MKYLVLLAIGTGCNPDHSLAGKICPDVVVNCPEPVIELGDLSCPSPTVNVSNTVSTQPIADEIANLTLTPSGGNWHTIYFPYSNSLQSWTNTSSSTYVLDRDINISDMCVDVDGGSACMGHLGIQDTPILPGGSVYNVLCENDQGCLLLGQYFNY